MLHSPQTAAVRYNFCLMACVQGCTIGSLIGGRWSDYSLAKSKEANGGVGYPEVTLVHNVPSLMY